MTKGLQLNERLRAIRLAFIQDMDSYHIVGTDNGDLYYLLKRLPRTLYNTGESVSPDEIESYPFVDYNIENILDLIDCPSLHP